MKQPIRVVTALLVVASAVLAGAQQPLAAVGYVDVQYLVSLHPSYPQIQELLATAQAELEGVASTVRELSAKQQVGQLTQEQEELLNVSVVTLQTLEARYDEELSALSEPARLAIDAAIAQVATSLGIGVVLDTKRAFEARLIVYGAPANDLTQRVAEILQAGGAQE